MPRAPSVAASDPRLVAIVAEQRRDEPRWRTRARGAFNDAWSRGDDFANAERTSVRRATADGTIGVSSVLLAVDADIRATRPLAPERGAVPPCVPRPFYD